MAMPRIAVPPALDLHALTGFDPTAQIADLAGETMGTSWRVRLAAAKGTDLAGIRTAIKARLDGLVHEMSHWAPDSLLMRFNGAAGGSWSTLPSDFSAVIEAGLAIAERSGGAFDPAAGRLTDLHGLGPNEIATPPNAADIDDAFRASGWRRLAFDTELRRLRQPGGCWLDLSGIAKGYAVDAVADLLASKDIRHALVEIGGECAGRGLRPDGDPWWVDLETPPGVMLRPLRIALHQLTVATSGNYVRGDHNLDPRSGRPAYHGLVSASVIHASAMHADAWATALTVLGPEAGAELAKRESLAARLVWMRDVETEEWLSPALENMLGETTAG